MAHAMPQWMAAAAAVASLLEQVDGVGKVYIGEEDARTLLEMAELAVEPSEEDDVLEQQASVNVWQLGRTSVSIERGQLPPQQRFVVSHMVVRGYLGMGEGTWDTFQSLIDEVIVGLEGLTEIQLTEARTDIVEVSAPQVTSILHATLGPYACHSCEIRMDFRERRTVEIKTGV